jgi:hypothetical protein
MGNGYLYYFDAYDVGHGVTNRVLVAQVLDAGQVDQWYNNIVPDLPFVVGVPATALCYGFAYLLGGVNFQAALMGTPPAAPQWTAVQDVPAPPNAAACLGNWLYIFGHTLNNSATAVPFGYFSRIQ